MKKSVIALLSICMTLSFLGACATTPNSTPPPISPSTSESTGGGTSGDSTTPELPDDSSTGGDNSSTGGGSNVNPELPDDCLAAFNLGNDGSASHNDGTLATTKTYTNNGYTLTINGTAQMWADARDAKGNGCIKLGTGSNTGSLNFTVASGVNSVTLDVAKYKDKASALKVNGTQYTLTKNSNDGQYETITVDTSANKTVTVETTSSGKRVMINTISFYGQGTPSSGGGSSGGDSSTTGYTYTDFTASEKSLFRQYFGEVIPFVPNNEYYVKEYSQTHETGEVEAGINFYTFGNTQADFDAYRAKFSAYKDVGTYKDDYGDTWYCYDGNGYCVDMAHYYDSDEGGYWLDVYVYTLSEDDGNGGGSSGGSTTPDNVMTNAGAGLPTSANGVYNVDFTKATYVKDVTDQLSYLDGCPTLSTTTKNPAVLVVPVEFSDVTAASKGYSIDKIEKAWTGAAGTTTYYSVRDYYYTSSYGKLDLDITVLDDWFKPKYNSSYYLSATIDYYGQQIEGGDQLIIDEILAYYESRMDLSQFDSDGNGTIDAIVLINTLDINPNVTMQWAYRYRNLYTNSQGYYYEYDGVFANDYMWASYKFMYKTYDENGNTSYDSSIINTYTFIHEFGHVLGADDYYDTSYSTEEGPMSGCDVMDAMAGDHNAYTKFNYGWLTSSRLVVADGSVTLTLEDFSKNGDTIIIANNWDEKLGIYQEYYILVYYKNVGLNAGEAGYFSRDGIVVYHVNASLYSEEYDGETYYDVYNNNTDVSDQYGTQDNLIEYVKSVADTFTYVAGDSISANTTDDQGNKIAYTFTVDALTDTAATITFTKNA